MVWVNPLPPLAKKQFHLSNYQGNYEPPEENYEAPVTYGPKPQPEWQKPDQQYSKPPYVAPTNPEPKYHYPSGTKPPVSIRFLFVLYFFKIK